MKKKDLIRFEDDIAETFNKGMIKAPVHLHSGNEDFLINFFKKKLKKMIGCFVLGDLIINVYLRECHQKF